MTLARLHPLLVLACLTDLTACIQYQAKGENCQLCCSGPPGAPGVHGNHGLPGTMGPEGQKGTKGDKGHQGQRGPKGPRGDTGKKGARGKVGQKGSCGAPGHDGAKGYQGPMGPMGPKGDKGSKGEKPVKTPKIAFFVKRKSRFGPVNQETTIEFDKVILNTGNAFSELTSHFICNVNGTYLFNIHILSQENKDAFVMVMLNEQPQIPIHGDHRSGFGVASNSVIFHLEEGDHVWLRLAKDSAISNDSSTFSGFLIYDD